MQYPSMTMKHLIYFTSYRLNTYQLDYFRYISTSSKANKHKSLDI